MDRATTSCATRCISACATTRSRATCRREDATGRGRPAPRSLPNTRRSRRERQRRGRATRCAALPTPAVDASSISCTRSRTRASDGDARAARRRRAATSRTSQGLLAEARSSPRAICCATTRRCRRCILPVVADRPLVMKRFPNGVDGQAFYQQRAPERRRPACASRRCRDDVEPIDDDGAAHGSVGGSLMTLLYMTQIAAISQDPWFSRVPSPHDADYVGASISTRATARPFAQRARRRALGPATSCDRLGRPGRAEDVGLERPAHLHPAAAEHAVRGRACCSARSSRRSWRRAPEGGDGRAHGQARPRRHGLRGLPAEHPGQDAGDAPTARGRATSPASRRR